MAQASGLVVKPLAIPIHPLQASISVQNLQPSNLDVSGYDGSHNQSR